MGGESTEHRYNLTFSLNARNIINHENLNTFNGSMTSQLLLPADGHHGWVRRRSNCQQSKAHGSPASVHVLTSLVTSRLGSK